MCPLIVEVSDTINKLKKDKAFENITCVYTGACPGGGGLTGLPPPPPLEIEK